MVKDRKIGSGMSSLGRLVEAIMSGLEFPGAGGSKPGQSQTGQNLFPGNVRPVVPFNTFHNENLVLFFRSKNMLL